MTNVVYDVTLDERYLIIIGDYAPFSKVKRMMLLDLSNMKWLKHDEEIYLEFEDRYDGKITIVSLSNHDIHNIFRFGVNAHYCVNLESILEKLKLY